MEQGKGEGKAVVKGGQAGVATATEKTNKQKKKGITVTAKELQELGKDFIVQCDPTTAPQRFKAATILFRCDLCKRHFETPTGAKGHTQEKKHIEKKNLKKVEEELKLVGLPNEEQFDAITAKLQEVYDEQSAEACGQRTVREKIVFDFQEFVQQTKGCEGVVVELFGSTYTGFALKSSDINMNLRFSDHTADSSKSYYSVIIAVVERLTTMATNGGDDVVYGDLKNDLYSSVSHITFMHRPSGLSCHVRFGSHHGVPICTGKLLQRYGTVDHRVKVLAVVLKYWAKLCQLDIQELGSYPSQMFVLMLIHFLQHRTPPLLPVPPKPHDFNDMQQCLEHFDEYLSGLDHMIETWTVSNTESLGMLWFGMFRFYCEEGDLGEVIVQTTESAIISKKDSNWSANKLVVLSPVHPSYNMAKACSSQNMYLYLKICFKATMVYFGRNSLSKPSTMPPNKDQSIPQDVTPQEASHDPSTTGMTSPEASHDPSTSGMTSQEASHGPSATGVTSQETSHDPFTTGVTSQEASHDSSGVTSQGASHDPSTMSVTSQEASHDPSTIIVTSQETSHDPSTTVVASQEASHDPSADVTSQGASHDPDVTSQQASDDSFITKEETPTTKNSSKNCFTYLTDIKSQLSDFSDADPIRSNIQSQLSDFTDEPSINHLDDSDIFNQTTSTTTRSHDLDCDTSYDLDHDESLDPDYDVSHDLTSEVETSCEHNDTHLQDSVVVEDIEVINDDTDDTEDKELKYEFISSSFVIKGGLSNRTHLEFLLKKVKKLPDVCSHCKQEGHIFTNPDCPDKEEQIILATHLLPSNEQLKQLDGVFTYLKDRICLKSGDKKQRKEVCHILEQFIKVIYPSAELMLFGSSANEFGSPASDIDISMKLPRNFDHDEKARVIQKIAHELKHKRQYHWWVTTVQPITTARVPIVKMQLMQRWNNLECDISLGNYLALHNTQLLAHYAKIDKRVQVMGYVLKEFAKSADMCDASSGSLSSYAYIILLLHYLQQVKPPVIPVLQQIGEGGHVDVDGWNCWFHRFDDLSQLEKIWPHVGENKKTIGELLINFFKYYLEEFNWKRHVVCIRQLELLSKLEKQWASKRACIEDPFNHDHNLSSHLSNKMWSYIRSAFKHAHDHITDPKLYSEPVTISSVLTVGFTKNVPQDGLCHTCGKRGHMSRNCPSNVNKTKNFTCFRCGKKGHVRAECPLEMSPTGESPDGDSMPQPSATLEVKRKRKNKTVAKVNEGKTNEATVTDASPKTQNATETLLSHSNNFEYPPSPIKQSSPLLPEPSSPRTTTAQFLPPYPQPHPSVPYTASRHPVHSMSPRYNQQPQTRHSTPMSVPTAGSTTRPYLMATPQARPPYAEFNSSPPIHQYYSHLMQQQSPPTDYGSTMYSSSSAGNYYLFPPPSSPANTVSQAGYDKEIHTAVKQIGKSHHHRHQPQAHNPQAMLATYGEGLKAETDHKHKKSKSKPTKSVTKVMGSSPAPVSLADVKQGKPAIKMDTYKSQPVSKGRGRTPRDASGVVHHGGKRQHPQRT